MSDDCDLFFSPNFIIDFEKKIQISHLLVAKIELPVIFSFLSLILWTILNRDLQGLDYKNLIYLILKENLNLIISAIETHG